MPTQTERLWRLQVFGEAAVEAVLKELKQLHDHLVIEPVNADKMTLKEKQGALAYLMFLKEKRTGEIKGRGCADGRKQRATLTKEETSSPTVAIESILISSTIDAHEKRDVGKQTWMTQCTFKLTVQWLNP